MPTKLFGRASNLKVSAFVIALLSPVLQKMVCGDFRESIDRKLILDDVDKAHFLKLMQLGCGEDILEATNIETMLQLAGLSERLQMNAVTVVLEDTLIQELKAETCVEMLARGDASGLKRLQVACDECLWKNFAAISKTDDFLQLSEETMKRLLEEDELETGGEEDVFEAVLRWMTRDGEDAPMRGNGLLREIRFGVIEDAYLAERMMAALPGHDGLKQLMAEAMVKKGTQERERMWDGVERLNQKWLVPRGLKGKDIGCGVLKQPQYVAIDSQGRILVSDDEIHQVVVFHYDGSVSQRIGSEGRGEGQFKEPGGIAVDQGGDIFVADRGNHRIQVFNAKGSFVRCFGSRGTAVGQLTFPSGVAIDLDGRVVVADLANHRIQVFNPDGSAAFHFGLMGRAIGELWGPSGLAVDRAGRIVVSEIGNHRVQVFNRDASVAWCFGSSGSEAGRFSNPMGVAVDREGSLVVADNGNHRVQVLNADGSVLRVMGRRGGLGVVKLKCPNGVAVDGAGRILVADSRNGRVQVL